MDMPALRYAPAVRGFVGQLIALDHRDGPEEISIRLKWSLQHLIGLGVLSGVVGRFE